MLAPGQGRPNVTAIRLALRGLISTFALCMMLAEARAAATAHPAATVAEIDSQGCCCGILPRPQDQIWLVSCRGLGCDDGDPAALEYWYYADGTGWVRSEEHAFRESAEPGVRTTVFVHGNRISSGLAFDIGVAVYRAMACHADTDQPIRLVIWSWPSERIDGGQLEDVRVKFGRTKSVGHRLARWIARLDENAPLTLIGYSFGSPIVTSSLHLLGGGAVNGYSLDAAEIKNREPARAVLIAPAMDNDWLLPGCKHGLALGQVERMLIVTNSCDGVLKRYHRLYCRSRRHCGPEALGYTGLAGAWRLGDDRAKIEHTDVCCRIGKQHDWRLYIGSSSLMRQIAPYVFDPPL